MEELDEIVALLRSIDSKLNGIIELLRPVAYPLYTFKVYDEPFPLYTDGIYSDKHDPNSTYCICRACSKAREKDAMDNSTSK